MSAEKQEVKTLADALPEEITRVRKIQDEFKSLRGRPGIIVEPQIMMMEHDIVSASPSLSPRKPFRYSEIKHEIHIPNAPAFVQRRGGCACR